MVVYVDANWQVCSSGLPGDFLKLMDESLDTGAMTLSSAHISSLNQYVCAVRKLPQSTQDLLRWLGSAAGKVEIIVLIGVMSSSPQLSPDNILSFIRNVKAHANRWQPLFAKNLQLAMALTETAGKISMIGPVILEVCSKTKALGKRREAWDELLVDTLTPLSPEDKQIISTLPKQVIALKRLVSEYDRQVEHVRDECTGFRDDARTQLVPAAVKILQALDKLRGPTSKDFSTTTMAKIALKTRIAELSDPLRTLEQMLREVLTASSHFHSAWQSFDSYIDASQDKIQEITSQQQLAFFAIYFSQFLGLWRDIEQSTKQMTDKLSSLQLSAA